MNNQITNSPKFKVILASPFWGVSGVNIFTANLARGLIEKGIPSHILLSGLDYLDSNPMQLPLDIPVERLAVEQNLSWSVRWQNTINYLESKRPCIYIPNADFWHSGISPKLSDSVGIIGIIHSDDPVHYEHASRLGKYWNVIVAVSKTIAEKTAKLDTEFSKKLVVIPCGVSVPDVYPQRIKNRELPLRVVYAGRLVQHQKRVLDLPKIVEAVLERKVPIELSIIGNGSEQEQLIDVSKHLMEQGFIHILGALPNEKVLEYFQQSDVFILTSDFEGMPVSLLEAMGRGCVPVVTDIDSGIPEVIRNGENGYCVPIGDIQAFAERLAMLYQDFNQWEKMSLNAYHTIWEGGYRAEDMVEKYMNLFQNIMQEVQSGSYKRPRGPVLPPPFLQKLWKKWIPKPLLNLGRYGKHILKQVLT